MRPVRGARHPRRGSRRAHAIAELFGGIGPLLGILTRFTGVALSIVMVTAIFVAWLPDGTFYGGLGRVILGGLLVLNGAGRPTLASVLGRGWLSPEELLWARLRG